MGTLFKESVLVQTEKKFMVSLFQPVHSLFAKNAPLKGNFVKKGKFSWLVSIVNCFIEDIYVLSFLNSPVKRDNLEILFKSDIF